MIQTELKIILTCLLLWTLTDLIASPNTAFGKWGEKKFKCFLKFKLAIKITYCLPIILTFIYWLWNN